MTLLSQPCYNGCSQYLQINGVWKIQRWEQIWDEIGEGGHGKCDQNI